MTLTKLRQFSIKSCGSGRTVNFIQTLFHVHDTRASVIMFIHQLEIELSYIPSSLGESFAETHHCLICSLQSRGQAQSPLIQRYNNAKRPAYMNTFHLVSIQRDEKVVLLLLLLLFLQIRTYKSSRTKAFSSRSVKLG
jgi:hypothetical protein